MMFTLHTVDGCEILHHQFWMVETLEIVGCLPPMKNHRPQLVQHFATIHRINLFFAFHCQQYMPHDFYVGKRYSILIFFHTYSIFHMIFTSVISQHVGPLRWSALMPCIPPWKTWHDSGALVFFVAPANMAWDKTSRTDADANNLFTFKCFHVYYIYIYMFISLYIW